MREPERDGRFDFTGGHVVPSKLQRPEKFLILSGRKDKYSGFGLPGLTFHETSINVAEFGTLSLTSRSVDIKRGQVFRENTDKSVVFLFCGLARPKTSDIFAYFLADKERVSECHRNSN